MTDYIRLSLDRQDKIKLRLIAKSQNITTNKLLRDIILEKLELKQPLKKITFEYIRQLVSEYTGISVNVISERTRKREIVVARQLLQSLCFDYLKPVSLSRIGKITGGFDHSTILHAFKNVKNIKEINSMYNELKTIIDGSIQKTR